MQHHSNLGIPKGKEMEKGIETLFEKKNERKISEPGGEKSHASSGSTEGPCGEIHPTELSGQLRMRMSCPEHNLFFQRQRRWQFPLAENAQSPSPKMAFIGISMCREIEHTCISHQSMPKGYS